MMMFVFSLAGIILQHVSKPDTSNNASTTHLRHEHILALMIAQAISNKNQHYCEGMDGPYVYALSSLRNTVGGEWLAVCGEEPEWVH